MIGIRIGVQIKPQHITYDAFAALVRRADSLGFDTIWTWDHFFPLSGDPDGMHFEAWTLLTAMATLTQRAEVGLLVTGNSYRNPNLLADMARTVDHISHGRLILGIGAGWAQRDYEEYGYEFGTAGSRLKALEENLRIIKARWCKLNPPPTRKIPVLVGGGGEKVTLRITAAHADIWNGFGPPESFKHKNQVLDEWCRQISRDPLEIERSVTFPATDVDRLEDYVKAGANHLILGTVDSFDFEAAEKLVAWRERLKRS
jgi:probable F420-dependent oxidoreductase